MPEHKKTFREKGLNILADMFLKKTKKKIKDRDKKNTKAGKQAEPSRL